MNARPVVVGLGEILWDCFGEVRRAGGAPANVAFHAAQLGAQGVACSRVGQDALGDELLDYLTRHGLPSERIQRDPDRPTGTVTVHPDAGAGPSYTIHADVAWDFLEATQDWLELCAAASAICFGTLAQRSPRSREAICACLDAARDALLVYDVNLRPPFVEKAWIEESLRRCHVAKLNDDERRTLAPMLGLPAGPEAFLEALTVRYGLQGACITRGAEGALAMVGGETADTPGVEIAAADTVGAGDAFAAAFTLGMLWKWPLRPTLALADGAGALVASRPGAMTPLADEFAALTASLRGETS